MRVLCVGTDFPPGASGGYELQCAGAVAHLRAHGCTVRVLTSGPGGSEPGDVHRDLRRFPLDGPPVDAAEAWRGERHNATALAWHLRAFRPDAVSWWRLGELSVSLPERARGAGVPAVGMVCDPWMLEAPERDPWARGRRPDYRGRWLFVSRWLRDRVARAGVDVARADVVPAGIEPYAFGPEPVRPWAGRLLYAGRLSPLKGVDVAIAALRELPGTTLAVVGDGPPAYVATLRAAARELGERVAFLPPQAPDGMRAVYAAADAVLFPVRWDEPWGLVPLEAMATGRPVVATGTGGSGEYLRDGENALVVPPGEAGALAAAVRRLAGSPTLRAHLVATGRTTAAAHPAERSHAAVREALEAAAATRTATAGAR